MYKSRWPVGPERGFTLLELIIAITLLSLIVLIITGALRLGYRSIEAGERRIDAVERYRSSLTIISAQIQSATPLTLQQNGVKQFYFEGSRDAMKFTTNYSIWSGQKGYVIVAYRVKTDDRGMQNLYAGESKVGAANPAETMLLQGFNGIFFEYFHKGKTDETGTWDQQWTDDTDTPHKVRLRLVSGMKEITLIIPMRAQGML